jgi:hypothetical protein
VLDGATEATADMENLAKDQKQPPPRWHKPSSAPRLKRAEKMEMGEEW